MKSENISGFGTYRKFLSISLYGTRWLLRTGRHWFGFLSTVNVLEFHLKPQLQWRAPMDWLVWIGFRIHEKTRSWLLKHGILDRGDMGL